MKNPVWTIDEGTNIRCEKNYVLYSGICPVYKGTDPFVAYFMMLSVFRIYSVDKQFWIELYLSDSMVSCYRVYREIQKARLIIYKYNRFMMSYYK
jgi:hypothetical protein